MQLHDRVDLARHRTCKVDVGEGSQVSFDAVSPERVLIAYYDEDAYFPDATYAIEMLTGDGDNQLEAWETMLITVELPPGQLVAGSGSRWSYQLRSVAPSSSSARCRRSCSP